MSVLWLSLTLALFFLSQTLSTVTRMRESFEWRGEGGVGILVHRRLSHLKG